MSQLDTADRQTAAGEEPSETVLLTEGRLRQKLAELEEEVKRLAAIEKALLASPDKQISLTDPDCRSMATSGRGSGMVAYNVQSAVDTTNHLIVAHEVTNVGTDRSQLATMAQAAKAALRSDHLDVVADRGYFKGEELLACEQAGVAVTLPNPQAMRVRRETVEHPFATLKMRMGATHFLMKRLPNVATEMALNVLAYNLTRVMNIVGIKPLLVAIRA